MNQFEYDPEKSGLNEFRHGISLGQAQAIWGSAHVVIPAKDIFDESRHAIVGKINDRLFVVIFTKRGESIRIISCHRAGEKLRRIYEKYIA